MRILYKQLTCTFDSNSALVKCAVAIIIYTIIVPVSLLINSNCGYSQSKSTIYSQLQTESIIQLPFNERPINVQICFDGSKTYILDESTPKNQILLRNINNLLDDTLSISLSDSMQISSKSKIQSISINHKYIAIAIHKKILLFERAKGIVKYIRVFETRFPCNYMKISNSTLIGVSSRIANVDFQNHSTWLFRISIDKRQQYFDGVKLSEPVGIEFTYFAPQIHVVIHDSIVIVADIVRYHMNIYNYNGTLIDSITKNTSTWFSNRLYVQNTKLKDTLRTFFQYPKNNIELLRPYFDSLRILRDIAILNDNYLLIAWQLPEKWVRQDGAYGPPKMNYDIWKYENHKWNLLNSDLTDILPESSDSIVKWNHNHYLGYNYYTTNEALYRLRHWIPNSINSALLTFNDVNKIMDSLAVKNISIFSLFKIKMLLNDTLMNTIKVRNSNDYLNQVEVDSLIGCTINSTTAKLYSSDSAVLVMLVNDYNCHDCIVSALDAINYSVQHSKIPVKAVLLTRARKSTINRLEAIKKIRMLSKQYQVLFDCVNGDQDNWPPIGVVDGVFGLFDVSKTPALIIINKDKQVVFIDYDQMNRLSDTPDKLSEQINKILEIHH